MHPDDRKMIEAREKDLGLEWSPENDERDGHQTPVCEECDDPKTGRSHPKTGNGDTADA